MDVNKIDVLPHYGELMDALPEMLIRLVQYLSTTKAPMSMTIFYCASHNIKPSGNVEATIQMGIMHALTGAAELVPWDVFVGDPTIGRT